MPDTQSVNSEFALIVGEALIDLVQYEGDPTPPVAHPGGSPFNVGVTLGRLDRPVQLCTWFAGDDYGKLITDHLDESKVEIVSGSEGASNTTTAMATLDSTGSASYTFEIEWKVPPNFTVSPKAAYVHTGSIGAILEPGSKDVLEIIREASKTALVTYDPNARPTIMPSVEVTRPLVEEYVSLSDLIKVSDEDLEWLYPGKAIPSIVSDWFELGHAGLIIVTGGEKGPEAWTRNGVNVARKPEPVRVVDTVGAGDSFMGALINSLWERGITFQQGAKQLSTLSEQEVTALLDEAGKVAGITVSRAGANPPWTKELQ